MDALSRHVATGYRHGDCSLSTVAKPRAGIPNQSRITNIEATIDNNFLALMTGAYRAFAHLWHTIYSWTLPVMMDKAEAMPLFRAARDLTLVLTGAATVICFSTWAPVLRHLWVLAQVGMLARRHCPVTNEKGEAPGLAFIFAGHLNKATVAAING